MKHLLFAFLLLSASMTGYSQIINESQVPKPVLEKFKRMYPGDVVKQWMKEKSKYEAEFLQNNKTNTSVLFSAEGKLLESESDIDQSTLPAAAKEYIKKEYPGGEITECSKIIASSGKVTYEAEVRDAILIFDSKGKFLRKEEGSGSGDED